MFRALIMMVVIAIAFPVAPVAGSSLNCGTYRSTVEGGQLLPGKSSESRPTAEYTGTDEALELQAHHSGQLDNQWHASCVQESRLRQVTGSIDLWGTGVLVSTSEFTGGTFTLGYGPWGSGQGVVDSTVVTVQRYYYAGLLENILSSFTVFGHFPGNCTFVLTEQDVPGFDTTIISTSDPFPPLLPPTCDPNAPRQCGVCSYLDQPVLMIENCTVPTYPTTWGAVKAVYR